MGSNSGQDCERPIHRVWIDSFLLAATQVTNAEYARFLRATASAVTAILARSKLQPSAAARRRSLVARSRRYCEWLSSQTRPHLSPAHRSRMGTRRPRRPRTKTVPLGRRSPAISARLCHALANRPRASRPLRPQCLRPLRHLRQRPRMVQRLVRPELLRHLARTQSARPRTKPHEAVTQILPRRLLAPPHQSSPLLRPLQHPSRIPICRLRLPRSICVRLTHCSTD